MDIITPLFGINVSLAFTDLPSNKSRGDLLEAGLGFAFMEHDEREGNSKVLQALYSVMPGIVEVCVDVWTGGV